MFTPKVVPPSLIALAVAAAFSTPVRADGIPLNADAPIQAAQTYFPVAGAFDAERSNSLSVIAPLNADYAYLRGISGKGDGKCADFNEKSKLVRLVWEDNR